MILLEITKKNLKSIEMYIICVLKIHQHYQYIYINLIKICININKFLLKFKQN